MPDDNLSVFIDRLLVHLRSPLETDLHALAQDFQRQAGAAQAAAVEDAVAAERRDSQLQIDRLKEELAQVRRMRHAATLASETLSGVTTRTQQIVDAIRAIDAAGSIGDVLERLAHAAKGYAQRSVLLMVRGSSLTAWRLGDFPDLTGTSIPVDGRGLIARAIAQRQPLARLDGTPESEGALPAFAVDGRSRDAVALPMVLGGEAVAVLYADALRGGTDPVDRRWPLALEVVTCYATRVIEAMTLQRSAGLAATSHASRRDSETAS